MLNQYKKISALQRNTKHLFTPWFKFWKAESFDSEWHISALSARHQSPACKTRYSLPINLTTEGQQLISKQHRILSKSVSAQLFRLGILVFKRGMFKQISKLGPYNGLLQQPLKKLNFIFLKLDFSFFF